ncbi:MAG: hypothetical protein BroJett022_11140 [Actinomycetes bacterium]|nr:MAG: hypothetical protein BroJett022_11140 [Actinomycetes bacterium]
MRPRSPLSYANVVSTIALCMALGGGAAIAAGQIDTRNIEADAVTTPKIAPGAVTAKRLADHAVRSRQLARRAVGPGAIANQAVTSRKIAAGAVAPNKMQFPVHYVASPTGGSQPVTNSFDPYPLQGASWSQGPGEINVAFGEIKATLAYDGGGAGNCQVYFDIRLNGVQVGGGEIRTDSTSPTEVTGGLGAQPAIDPTSEQQNEMTVNVGSNGGCTPGSTIDSTRFRILDFG